MPPHTTGTFPVSSSDPAYQYDRNPTGFFKIIYNYRVGSLNEQHLYAELVRDPAVKTAPVESIMQPAFPFVDISTPVELLSTMITSANPAVLVRDFKTEKTFIITRSDVIRVLC